MYGKHFASMYEGSMVGSGAVVFAVMGYCIAKADSDTHTILLNPSLLSPIFGEPVDRIEAAIKYLTSPDPNSKNPAHEGRRLLHESGFSYLVVSHEDYRNMKNMSDVREYERDRKRKQREKSNVPDIPGQSGTPASVSVSDSSLIRGSEEGDHIPAWEAEFEECWKLYPDKSGKLKAKAAYKKAYKEGTRIEDVLRGLNRYACYIKTKRAGGFRELQVQNGSTWFNQRGWENEYTIEDKGVNNGMPKFD